MAASPDGRLGGSQTPYLLQKTHSASNISFFMAVKPSPYFLAQFCPRFHDGKVTVFEPTPAIDTATTVGPSCILPPGTVVPFGGRFPSRVGLLLIHASAQR